MKPLRKKLQKCRDPDRVDLVALQRARREQGTNKDKKVGNNSKDDDVFGGALGGQAQADARDTKRRKVDKLEDPFGPPL